MSTSTDDTQLSITTQATQESHEEIKYELYKKDDTSERALKILQQTRETSQNTLDTLTETLNKLNATLASVKETTDRIDKFKEDFGNVMNQMVATIGATFGQQLFKKKPKPEEIAMTPKVSNVVEVLKEVITKSHIVVLTGAGLSAASNIPTFRGAGGYWTLRNSQEAIKASDFLTHKYFLENPSEIWRWHHEFKKIQVKNAPNVSHHALANLQALCKRQPEIMKCTMITQNIDAYHVEAFEKAIIKSQQKSTPALAIKNKTMTITSKPVVATQTQKKPVVEPKKAPVTAAKPVAKKPVEEKKTAEVKKITTTTITTMTKTGNASSAQIVVQPEPKKGPISLCADIFEIHGNINLMRCDNDCTTNLYQTPVGCADDFVPKCPNCEGIARPHTLFFDEGYKEAYYRGNSIYEEISSVDCLIVIGTALETSLAARIVEQAVSTSTLVIEVNPEPCISYGNVRHLIGFAEKFIPDLCEGIQREMISRSKK